MRVARPLICANCLVRPDLLLTVDLSVKAAVAGRGASSNALDGFAATLRESLSKTMVGTLKLA